MDKVEELVMNRVPSAYEDQVVHRLVPIEDSPEYKSLSHIGMAYHHL